MGTNYQPLQMPSMPNPVSTGLDRMVAAAREKKRQEEETARMLLNYGQFEESKRQARVSEGFQARGEGRDDQYVEFAKDDRKRTSEKDQRTQSLERQARIEQIRAAYQAGKITAEQAQEAMQREGAQVYGPQAQAQPQGGSPVPDAQEFGDGVMPLPYDRSAVAQGAQAVGNFLSDGRFDKPTNPGAQFSGSNFLAAMPGQGERQLQTLSGPGPVSPSPQPANAPAGSRPLVFSREDERYTMESPEAVRARAEAVRQSEIQRYANLFKQSGDKDFDAINADAMEQIRAGLDPMKVIQERNDLIARVRQDRVRVETARKRGGGGAGGPGKRTVYDPSTGAQLGNAPDDVTARTTRKALSAYTRLRSGIQDLLSSYEQDGATFNPFGEAHQRRKAIGGKLELAVKDVEALGAIQGRDYSFIENMLGGTMSRMLATNPEQLQEVMRLLDEQAGADLSSIGIDPSNLGKKPNALTRAVRADDERKAAGNKKAANVLKRGGKPQAEVDGEDDQFLSGSGF